jgi:hypothetical protein
MPSATDINQNYIYVPFNQVVVSSAIAAGGSQVVPTTLDQDADFELHYILGVSSLDDNTKTFQNNFSVNITDKSNSRLWGSDRIPQVFLPAWNNSIPLRRPVLLARKTNMSFDILNLSGANPNTITIILMGFKVRNA